MNQKKPTVLQRSIVQRILPVLCLAIVPSPGQAQISTYWKGANGGDWFVGSNWTNGAPYAQGPITTATNAYISGGLTDTISGPVIYAPGMAITSLAIFVGYNADRNERNLGGTLSITGGSELTTYRTSFIGGYTGTATASGQVDLVNGSHWNSSSDIAIGLTGTGKLNILSGSIVNATFSLLGSNSTSGQVLIDGAGSQFNLSSGLVVGNSGQGLLTIKNGGVMHNGGDSVIGGAGSQVLVDGGTWNNDSFMQIKPGSSLTIRNGGVVNVGTNGNRQTISFSDQPGQTGSSGIGIYGGDLQASAILGGTALDANVHHFLTFQHTSSSYTFQPDLSGELEVLVASGTTIVTGNWSNTVNKAKGKSIFVTGGVLQIGDGGTVGSFNSGYTTLRDAGSKLVFNRADAIANATEIDGLGEIEQKGGGLLTLSGPIGRDLDLRVSGAGHMLITSAHSMNADKWGSGTLILTGGGDSLSGSVRQGILQIGNGGAAGSWNSGVLSVFSQAQFVIKSTNDLNLPVSFSGYGSIVKEGSNTLTLSQQMGGFLGNFSIAGTLAYDVSTNLALPTWAAITSGPGIFRKEGAGTLTIGNTMTNAGGIQLAEGGIIYDGRTTASNVVSSAGTQLTLRNGATYGGAFTGGGNLLIQGGSTVTGTLNHTGTITASNGGVFTLNSGGDSFLSGSVSVQSFQKLGSGTLTLTGPASASSAFTIFDGRVKVGNGGTTGNIASNVTLNGGTLEFARSDDFTFSNAITGGGGSVVKSGNARLTLGAVAAGNITVNGGSLYATGNLAVGNTSVTAGALTVLGVLGGATTVASGATLQLGDNTPHGHFSGSVVNHGSVIFSRTNETVIQPSQISGSGSLTKLGVGTFGIWGLGRNPLVTGGSSGALNVGGGSINISFNAAYVNAMPSRIGSVTGSSGDITVEEASVWTNTAEVYVGDVAPGTLKIRIGGRVETGYAVIGHLAIGYASISGSGSSWINTGGVNVGASYDGAMLIENGGLVSSGEGVIGFDANVSGGVLVTGANSRWNVNTFLDIGRNGTGSLTLGPGATVSANSGAGTIILGRSGAAGGTLFLGDNGSAVGAANGDTVKAAEIKAGAGTGTKKVIFNSSSTITLAPKITGAVSLDVFGSGRINLTGANTYSGDTNIYTGTLGATVSGAFSPTSYLSIANAPDAVLAIGSTAQTINWLSGGGYAGGIITMDTGGSLTTGGNNIASGFDGIIRGTNPAQTALLIKQGAAAFTLTGQADNANLGAVVDGGALILNSFSSSTLHALNRDTAVNTGGTLRLAGSGGDQIAKSVTITVNSGGSFDLNGRSEGFKSLAGTGAVTNTAAATISLLTLGEVDGVSIFAGNLSDGAGAAKLGLTKVGAGTLTLQGSNTYSGATTLSAGTLTLGSSTGLSPNSALTIASGATLNLGNFSASIGSLAGAGQVVLGSGALTINQTGTTSYTGVISGPGGLNKQGAGLLILAGDHAYGGSTNITGGTLQIGDGGTVGILPGNVINHGTLIFNRSDDVDYGGVVSGSGHLKKLGSGALTLLGTSSFSGTLGVDQGTVNLVGKITSGGVGSIASNGGTATLNIVGSAANWTNTADTLLGHNGGTANLLILGGGTAGDTFALVGRSAGGTGHVTVAGAGSSWTHSAGLVIGTGGSGSMLVSAGGVVSNADGMIGGDVGSSGSVIVKDTGSRWTSSAYLVIGGNGSGILNIFGGGVVKVGASGEGTLTLGNSGPGAGTLNIGAEVGETALAAGTVQAGTVTGGGGSGAKLVNFNHTDPGYTFAARLTGPLSVLQKAGTTILTGDSNYTGSTTVGGGQLVVNGSLLGSVLVQGSGRLSGSGEIGGSMTVQNGGTLSPGNSPGLFTIGGSLTMESGSVLQMEFGANAFDQLDIGGVFTSQGTLHLQLLNGYTPNVGDHFTIFPGTAITGDFSITTNLGGGQYWDTSALSSTGVVSVVPEPATMFLIGGGLFAVMAFRRRRV